MENKLDQRIKPLEDKLKDINKALELSEMRHQQLLEEWRRREIEELKRRGEKAKGTGESRNEDVLKSIEGKIDTMQTIVSKDISNILMKLEEFDKAVQEEKAMRSKFEERLKVLEKFAAPKESKDKDKEEPKESAPKEKDAKESKDASNSKSRIAQNLARETVPANKALVVVTLPADARLFLNDQLMRAHGSQRSFLTPPLELGSTFNYTLRMEVQHNGALRTPGNAAGYLPGRSARQRRVRRRRRAAGRLQTKSAPLAAPRPLTSTVQTLKIPSIIADLLPRSRPCRGSAFCRCSSFPGPFTPAIGPAGSARSGTAPSDEIIAPWKNDLKPLWKDLVDEGHSSPVVAKGRVYLHTAVKNKLEEQLSCYDAVGGKLLWSKSYERAKFSSFFGNGPRATPLVADDGVCFRYHGPVDLL